MGKTKTAEEKEQAALEKEQRAASEEVDESVVVEEPGDEPVEDEPVRNKVGMKRHVNKTREAIMNKAASARNKRKRADTEQLDDDGKRLQDAMEAEVRGEANEYDPPGDDPDDKKTAEPVDSGDDLVTITVDGSEQQVTSADVEKAGIAALQKESTADKRMKEATKFESALRNLESTLRKQAEDLNARQTAADGTVVVDGDANLPDAGAVAKAVEEQAEKVAEAIYSGDQDQVKESLAGLVAGVAQGRSDSTPPLDAKQFAQDVRTQIEELDATEEAETAAVERAGVARNVNSTFEKEFPGLYADDRGFRLTKAEFEGLCEERPNADRVELMRDAAATIDNVINPPVDNELNRRRARKRGADAETPTSSQRAEPDKPKRVPTRKQTAAKMAAARGQRIS